MVVTNALLQDDIQRPRLRLNDSKHLEHHSSRRFSTGRHLTLVHLRHHLLSRRNGRNRFEHQPQPGRIYRQGHAMHERAQGQTLKLLRSNLHECRASGYCGHVYGVVCEYECAGGMGDRGFKGQGGERGRSIGLDHCSAVVRVYT
jgi:hypothetical protein